MMKDDMIKRLMDAEVFLPDLLGMPDLWNTLDVDYFPPRVERLWLQYDRDHRLYIHLIHPTDEPCLFHKHRWEAAFKMVRGAYEMGLARCEREIGSDEAHALPPTARFVLSAGSYYEMTDTHALHYVRPLGKASLSLMMTGRLYPEPRVEATPAGVVLQPLAEGRKLEILQMTADALQVPLIKKEAAPCQ
jgi:hypothetical protein